MMSEGWWSTEAGGMDFCMAYSEPEVHPRRLGLIERLCRVAEEEGVELMQHFLPRRGVLADRGAFCAPAGEGSGRSRRWERAGKDGTKGETGGGSELEVEHPVMDSTGYGEGRGTMTAIAQGARCKAGV